MGKKRGERTDRIDWPCDYKTNDNIFSVRYTTQTADTTSPGILVQCGWGRENEVERSAQTESDLGF